MEPIYEQTRKIEDMHIDCFGRAKPSALLYFAQEAAGAHCQLLALDWERLSQQNLFWAVLRHRVQITRLPLLGETVRVETWPLPTTRTAYPRSVVAYDVQGQELFRAISLWVLMDARSRAMILPGKSGIAVPGTLRGTELSVPGSLVPKVLGNSRLRTVSYTDLDRNGHMNNTRYLDWTDDLLPSAYHNAHPVREFTVCYLSEAREGEPLRLSWELGEGPSLRVDAHRESGEGQPQRVFSVQMLY